MRLLYAAHICAFAVDVIIQKVTKAVIEKKEQGQDGDNIK